MSFAEGIIPPMITPLTEDDTLDWPGLEKLVNHLINGGVHGLFILGSSGEGPSLSYKVRSELIKAVCEQVDGRIPVLVGITDAAYQESLNMVEKAQQFGADAVVLAPPFYFNVDQKELLDYTNAMLDEIDLPVFLYNNPSLVKMKYGLEIVKELLPRTEVVGFKDSSGDMVYFHKLRKLCEVEDIALFMGPEELLLDTMIIGAAGGVPDGANIFPSLYVKLFEAVHAGDIQQGLKLHQHILQLSDVVYGGSKYGTSRIINGIKYAVSVLDICAPHVCRPFKVIEKEKAGRIDEFISSMKDKF